MDKATLDEMNAKVLAEFRANHGKVGGMFEGFPMILVHHKGAKSGTERIAPLVYTEDAGRYVIVASKGGAPSHPDWYHNLVAHPDITIEIGDDSIPVRASLAQGEERQRLFDAQAELMPNFKDYEKATAGVREIPVFLLTRR
ncbi:MAG: nitroreductase family deazaflavin-dependent oxidoreductase [Candidatus Eremiobacteraeota bacterium]|nr:nitroreductase family deazaflavin-dependent oxidoreductase [Candidatus Eremiobacteraeota bacterium]